MVVGALFVGLHPVDSRDESPHKTSRSSPSPECVGLEYLAGRYLTDLRFI
jgi:hypothetical protein